VAKIKPRSFRADEQTLN